MMRAACVLLMGLACLSAATAQGYTFLYWPDGLRGERPDGRRMLHVQTSHYGAAFDVNRADLVRLGEIADAPAYADAATQDDVVGALPESKLTLSVRVGEETYTCTRAAANVADHANYPVRLIDGGRLLHRFDILGLEFTNPAGERLDVDGRLEVSAWPDTLQLTLEVTPKQATRQCEAEISLRRGDSAYTASGEVGENGVATARLSSSYGLPLLPAALTVRDARADHAELPVCWDERFGAHNVTLPARQWNMAEELDRLDRYPFTVTNTTEHERWVPIVFSCEGPFQGVTGICPMIRDKEGRPTGIPVQLSKNWHRHAEQRMLYEGPWFHAATRIKMQPGETRELELAITYARWGGVPAASHAQLCLIGWGGNQRWDQAAIGSFGESITYDADVGLNRSMIDDVRPLMVRGMNDGQWEWTHNVGGGDFLVYHDASNTKRWMKQMKVAYLSHGPNLADVIYAGLSDDGKIAARYEVFTPRCDDVNRAYHHIRYDVREPVEFSRLALYQLGADNYNDHQFTHIARGSEGGMAEEWETERGGKKYLREPVECQGDTPWVALTGGIRSPQLTKGAWADRGLIVHRWKARLGGQDVPHPWMAVYGTENGPPSAAVELAPPPGLTKLLPGDFVEAELELLIVPQKAEDYYGPNEELRHLLTQHGGTWKVISELAQATIKTKEDDAALVERMKERVAGMEDEDGIGEKLEGVGYLNALRINLSADRVERQYPLAVSAPRFQLMGGKSWMPITVTGFSTVEKLALWVDGKRFDQSVHGNDFWQVDLDDKTGTYAYTYNVNLNARPMHFHLFEHPFEELAGATP